MQEMDKPLPKVGEMVLIDWPRTRWDGRQGILLAYRDDIESTLYGCVLIDQSAVAFKTVNICETPREPAKLMETGSQEVRP
jgi:hypothetical protein